LITVGLHSKTCWEEGMEGSEGPEEEEEERGGREEGGGTDEGLKV
jgi:hypothetical protein